MGVPAFAITAKKRTPSFDANIVVVPTSTPGEQKVLVGYRAKHTTAPDNVLNQLISMELAIDEAGMYTVRFLAYPEGTLPSTGWTDVNAWSTIQKNTTLTAIPAGYTEIYATSIASTNQTTSTGVTDMEKLLLCAHAGDEFLIIKEEIISGNGSGTTFLGLSWVDC